LPDSRAVFCAGRPGVAVGGLAVEGGRENTGTPAGPRANTHTRSPHPAAYGPISSPDGPSTVTPRSPVRMAHRLSAEQAPPTSVPYARTSREGARTPEHPPDRAHTLIPGRHTLQHQNERRRLFLSTDRVLYATKRFRAGSFACLRRLGMYMGHTRAQTRMGAHKEHAITDLHAFSWSRAP
jgi:hypothetical protein